MHALRIHTSQIHILFKTSCRHQSLTHINAHTLSHNQMNNLEVKHNTSYGGNSKRWFKGSTPDLTVHNAASQILCKTKLCAFWTNEVRLHLSAPSESLLHTVQHCSPLPFVFDSAVSHWQYILKLSPVLPLFYCWFSPLAPLPFVPSTFLLLAHPLSSSSCLNTGDWLSLLRSPLPLIAVLASPLPFVFSASSLCSLHIIFPSISFFFVLLFNSLFCPSHSLLIYPAIIICCSLFRDICIGSYKCIKSLCTGCGIWLIQCDYVG